MPLRQRGSEAGTPGHVDGGGLILLGTPGAHIEHPPEFHTRAARVPGRLSTHCCPPPFVGRSRQRAEQALVQTDLPQSLGGAAGGKWTGGHRYAFHGGGGLGHQHRLFLKVVWPVPGDHGGPLRKKRGVGTFSWRPRGKHKVRGRCPRGP